MNLSLLNNQELLDLLKYFLDLPRNRHTKTENETIEKIQKELLKRGGF